MSLQPMNKAVLRAADKPGATFTSILRAVREEHGQNTAESWVESTVLLMEELNWVRINCDDVHLTDKGRARLES